MLTTEIGTNVQTGLTGVHKPARPVWLTLSKMKLTSQLRSSHQDDQNAYVEHPIWSSNERVMTSGK